jgi:ELWxxDGT repeat protein
VKFDGEAIVFTADDGVTGPEPWMIRATGEIAQLADIVPGAQGSDPGKYVWSANKLFFTARDVLGDEEPYVAVFFDGGTTDADGGILQNGDGGTTELEHRHYTVACACNQTSGGLATLVLLLLLLRRRAPQ